MRGNGLQNVIGASGLHVIGASGLRAVCDGRVRRAQGIGTRVGMGSAWSEHSRVRGDEGWSEMRASMQPYFLPDDVGRV